MSDASANAAPAEGGDKSQDFLGYHDDDAGRLQERAPLVNRLRIDEERLPAFISSLYVHRLYSRRALAERSEKASEAFGKPGRGLKPLTGSFDALAQSLGWGPHLRARRLAEEWPQIVGDAVAAYTAVASYRNGVLVVQVTDAAWTAILKGMEQRILRQVNEWMAPTVVSRLVFRGPSSRTRTSGRLRPPKKGVRSDKYRANGRSQEAARKTAHEAPRKKSATPHGGWKDPGASHGASQGASGNFGPSAPDAWGGAWG